MPVPPAEPPRPVLSPPPGDMAREPVPPLVGRPTRGPGCVDITAPELPLPPFVGGARFDPAFRGAPNPTPLRPNPEPAAFVPPPNEGGGATTLLASCVPAVRPLPVKVGGGGTTLGAPSAGAEARVPVPPDTPTEGGGATTFGSRLEPAPLRFPLEVPLAALAFIDGGGGRTLALRECEPVFELVVFTAGGGGTTSVAPKIFPMRLLTNDPLPAGVGGGGTTACEGSGALPVGMRRMSPETLAEGGGATTAGAGMVSRAVRELARSGAETGGGTTFVSVIRTGALDISRPTDPGAGGTTFAASV